MKSLLITCAVFLLLAIADLPIGYYTLLRILVTIGACSVIISEIDKGSGLWVVIFGIIAILFNPIIPVHLHDKSAWMPIDIIASGIFIIKGLIHVNEHK